MKKILPLAVFLFVILAPQTFGQTDTMLNLNRYSTYILDRNNRLDLDYELASTDFDYYNLVAALGGNSQTLVDTPLEIALLSNSAGVIDIRPAEANAILPANNPRQADLKLGAAVLQELQVLRFLGDTAAAGRHEAVLQFITGRGNATRAEVEAFYRNGIRGLVSDAVDAEFTGQNLPTRMTRIKQILTAFLTTPNQTTYRDVLNEYRTYREALWNLAEAKDGLSRANDTLALAQRNGWTDLLQETQRSIRSIQETIRIFTSTWGDENIFSEILFEFSPGLVIKLQNDFR